MNGGDPQRGEAAVYAANGPCVRAGRDFIAKEWIENASDYDEPVE